MQDPTKILWEIALALDVHRIPRTIDYSGWTLTKGIRIFADPDVKCPNCESRVRTRRIWLVDDNNKSLLGCWKLDGSKVNPDIEIIHPHVYKDKRVCNGDFKLASDALFIGVAEGRHYYSTERWFQQLGHECPNIVTIICDDCGKDELFPPDYKRHLCYYCQDRSECDCDMCRRAYGEEQCRECEEWMERSELDEDLLCENCNNNTPRCRICGESEVENSGDFCDGCECNIEDCDEPQYAQVMNGFCMHHRYQCDMCDQRVSRFGYSCSDCEDAEDEYPLAPLSPEDSPF
jgi:hypothetical protein